jgi:hypothetical protein
MENVTPVVPPGRIFGAVNVLVMAGGAITTSVAEALFPAPDTAAETLPVTLFFTPGVVPVTVAVRVQVPKAPTVALLTMMLLGRPLTLNVPHPVPLTDPVTTTKPAGRISLKPTPVRPVVWLGFEMLKVNVTEPLRGVEGAENVFVIVGENVTS